MSEPGHHNSGLSNAPKCQASQTKTTESSPAPTAKEQEAASLIKQGKLQEAEKIYRALITAGTSNHTIYGKLAKTCGMQGKLEDCIELLKKALEIKPNYPEGHHNLGISFKLQGKLSAAITSYKAALKLEPNLIDAHNNLGIALQEQGDLNAAIASYKTALKLEPNLIDAHNNLGAALQEQGDLTAAISSYKAALQLKPNFIEAHYNLGNTFKEQGDLTAAITCYKNALHLKNNQPQVHNNLGNALHDQGDLTAAITAYNNALQLNPNYASAHYNLGNALQDQGDLTAAIACYRTAVQLNKNFPDAHNNLGKALHAKGQLTEALSHHLRALEINPSHSNATYSVGILQACKGNIQGSKHLFQRALELDQNNAAALFELSKNLRSIVEAQELAKKIDKVNRINLKKKDKSMLEFAAANAYHRCKEFTKSSQKLAQANQLKLSYQKSDLSNHLVLTQKITAQTRHVADGKSTDGTGRIFIVGAPRCGSTLLESVLATNSNIHDLGESQALRQAFHQTQGQPSDKESIASLADAYTEKIGFHTSSCTHTVDKNLYNFRYIEAIARAMPAAKIIHCHRNPLDNILSMLRSNLQAGNNYTATPLDAAKFLIHQEKIMRSFKRNYETHIYTFDYDEFTNQPRKKLPKLIKWLSLQWSDLYLHPEKNNRLIDTASVIQARQPINNNSVGGWKNYAELLNPAKNALRESGMFEL